MMNEEQAVNIKGSSTWNAVTSELDFRIQAVMASLRTCKEEDLKATQIRLEVYEEIKRLPQDVIGREQIGDDPDRE